MPESSEYNRAIGAALFLLAKEYVPGWKGWPKTESEILLLVGVGQREAHEARFELRELLLEVECRLGFQVPDDDAYFTAVEEVLNALVALISRYPQFAPRKIKGKPHYPEGFRRYVASLADPGQPGHALTIEQLAHTVDVPVELLKEWLTQ
jgi:hypothetical protein